MRAVTVMIEGGLTNGQAMSMLTDMCERSDCDDVPDVCSYCG